MATNYPASLDTFTNPTSTDTLNSITVPHASQHDNLNDAVLAIETELGVAPSGSAATVKDRLDAINPSAGTLTASASTTASAANGAISKGTMGYSDTGNVLTLQENVNSYVQAQIQNTNAGATASANLIVSNDQATASTHYGEVGINSSGFTGSGSLNTAGATYLAATTGELVLGTTTANGIHFVTNGAATDALAISSAGVITATNTIVPATNSTTVAPIQLTAGTALTTPLKGAIEFDANRLYFTQAQTSAAGRGYISAKQMVVASGNSGAATTTTPVSPFAAANDVLSSIEPASLYRFRGRYKWTATFTSGTANIQMLFAFSNAPAAFNYDFRTLPLTPATLSTTASRVGTITVTTATQISPSISATISHVTEFEGFFTSHATLASTLTPQFQMSATGSSTVATTFSFFEIEKVGASTDTLIAGNWA